MYYQERLIVPAKTIKLYQQRTIILTKGLEVQNWLKKYKLYIYVIYIYV